MYKFDNVVWLYGVQMSKEFTSVFVWVYVGV